MKKLFKILEKVGCVESGRWGDVMEVVKIMSSIEVKEKKWCDDFKNKNPDWYPLDLSKIGTWSTYDKCVSLVFSVENKKLRCDVTIYDGDSMYGRRKNKRFEAVLILPDSFIKVIEQKIMWALDSHAERAYEDYLENEKNLWIINYKNNLIQKL